MSLDPKREAAWRFAAWVVFGFLLVLFLDTLGEWVVRGWLPR